MTKTYNMSKIMRTAWALYRAATATVKRFGDYLRKAWAMAKAESQTPKQVTWTLKGNEITLNTTTGMITGQTYNMRSVIKDEFPAAKWDADARAWRVEPETMIHTLTELHDYFVRLYRMEAVAPRKSVAAATHRSNGICRHCGTYCYGDCRA